MIEGSQYLVNNVQFLRHRDLFKEIDRGNNDKVKQLLVAGVDVNRLLHQEGWSRTPLLQAVNQLSSNEWISDHNDIICMLVLHGADINIQDNYGDTALSVAIKDGNLELVKYLLEHGGRMDLKTNEDVYFFQLPTSQEILEIIYDEKNRVRRVPVENRDIGNNCEHIIGDKDRKLVVNLAGTLCKLELAHISAGSFMMGKPVENEQIPSSSLTQHFVTLTTAFWIGKYTVTQEQWEAVMGKPPDMLWLSYPADLMAYDNPVVGVSWTDAMTFCQRVTEFEERLGRLPKGYVYTLPTEAQWEYACRAGTTGPYNVVDESFDKLGWFGDFVLTKNGEFQYAGEGNSLNHLQPVGLKLPNAWGLYDMHGNVTEWCADWFGDYPSSAVTDPLGPQDGLGRILRGGAYWGRPKSCSSYARRYQSPDTKRDSYGFRLCLSALSKGKMSSTEDSIITTSKISSQYLFNAIVLNDISVIRSYIEQGGNVNVRDETSVRWTLLDSAIFEMQLEIVHYLLRHKPDVNLSIFNGRTPLMTAAGLGLVDIVNYLLDLGAAINATTSTGVTALMYAVSKGQQTVAELLISKGALKEMVDEDGWNARKFAEKKGLHILANKLGL